MTGIVAIRSYELEKAAAIMFSNMFTLRISQIAAYSCSRHGGIDIRNVYGNSVIEQSSFDMIGHRGLIYIHFRACSLYYVQKICVYKHGHAGTTPE